MAFRSDSVAAEPIADNIDGDGEVIRHSGGDREQFRLTVGSVSVTGHLSAFCSA
jgi:hypothetical protein